ncbi:MAG: class I SAM-dependent methyltransferase [Propionibacteriaceae bacterium]|nr:class I SAM-dependent methyltransferase [Micropruina sp.]
MNNSPGKAANTTARILARARDAGFEQSSAPEVGDLLSVLAASKPAGRILELGTGAGLGTVRILEGMSATAHLTTVELDPRLSAIAREEIRDPRVEFVVADGGTWLAAQVRTKGSYDLVFADTWPGKYDHLDEALALVAVGGLYIVDDLLPQPTWPDDHQPNVDTLVARLKALDGWKTVQINDATGVMMCVRQA